jgi:hypothetical protein
LISKGKSPSERGENGVWWSARWRQPPNRADEALYWVEAALGAAGWGSETASGVSDAPTKKRVGWVRRRCRPSNLTTKLFGWRRVVRRCRPLPTIRPRVSVGREAIALAEKQGLVFRIPCTVDGDRTAGGVDAKRVAKPLRPTP